MRWAKTGRLRRLVPSGLVAVVLGVLASLLVACGQSNGLLSSNDGAGLGDQLGAVSDAVQRTDCTAARKAAAQLEAGAARLSPTVAEKLRRSLRDGASTVAQQAARACRTPATTQETITTDTTVTPPPTTPTTTPPTTATTPSTTTTTPTPTTTTTPTAPTTPTPIPTTPTPTATATTPAPSGGATPGGATP